MTYSINLKNEKGSYKNKQKGVSFSASGKEKGIITTPNGMSFVPKVSPYTYQGIINQHLVYILLSKNGEDAEIIYHAVTEIGVHVNWMIGWDNEPAIDILNGPSIREDNLVYKQYDVDHRGGTLYVGVDPSQTFSIFMLSLDQDLKGACGGNLHMEDGRTIRVTGAWSSRSSVVNMFLPEKDHVVECHMAGQYLRCAVRVSWLRDHLPKDTYLRKEVDKDGEIKYNIYPIEGSEIYKELMIKKPSLCRSHWVKRA